MVEIGKWNKLKVVKDVDFGIYLDGGEDGEILMPNRYVQQGTKPGDEVDAFIYLDSEDRLIATTEQPFAQVGDFALLEVVATISFGAFLNWGLMKYLLVPLAEQRQKMEVGKAYVVYIRLDEKSGRIVGTARLEDYLDKTPGEYTVGQEVDLIIYARTDLGYKAIINKVNTGIIYHKDVFREVERGEETKGYIKQIRTDGKIDLILDKPGYEKVDEVSKHILEKLKEQKGFIPLVDKSPAEDIYEMFAISKKTFKKAIGGLYKARLITIEENGIKLIEGNGANE
jgi:predicted RNA-binding protein (virulence factor B family)